jgi:3-phenylpropionate/cinnamic acid dioxygenase small subunit
MDEACAWVARAAITELITRDAALNDAGDWDAVAALYTEDGRMNRPTAPDQFISGRAAILAAFRSRPRRASRHIVANVLVTLEGEARARASSQILLFTGRAPEVGPRSVAGRTARGRYDDTLVKTRRLAFCPAPGSLDFRA